VVGYNLLPYLRAQFPELPMVDYCHMEDPDWRDGGYPRLSLRYADSLDLQVVASAHLKQWMCERGGDPDRIAVCTINIDTDEWNPERYDRGALRSALGIPAAVPVVLYSARLERQKQPMVAMDVIRLVLLRLPEVHFLIAGDGQFTSYIRGFIRWYRLEPRVKALGLVSNQRIRELLAVSDVFFLPSQMEGISLAIYEAMSMAVVPVGAAVGGQRELVASHCGVLIDRGPRERDAYVDVLVRLLTDTGVVRRMGEGARSRMVSQLQDRTDGRSDE